MAAVNPKQKIILAVLGVALVVVWARALTEKPVHRPNPSLGSFHHMAAAVARPPSKKPADEKPPILKWKRDPFVLSGPSHSSGPEKPVLPTAAGPKPAVPLRLEGILWDARKPTALINGALVEVGSSVRGWKVVEIRENRVILSDGQSTNTLEM